MRLPVRRLPLLAALLPVALAATGCLHDSESGLQRDRREAFDLLEQGRKLKAQGDIVLARDTFLRAAELSERPVIYYEIGNTQYRLSNPEQAAVYYEKALALAPDFTLARAELDLVRSQIGEPPAAAAPLPGNEVVALAEPLARPPAVVADAAPAVEVEEPSTPAPTSPAPAPTETPTPPVTSVPALTAPPASGASSEPIVAPSPGTGPLSGIGQAFRGLAGPGAAEGKEVDISKIDRAELRRVVFPELDAQTPFVLESERTAAGEAERLGRHDDAARRWSRIITAENGADAASRVRLAESLARSGRTRRAEEELLKALAMAPNDAAVWFAAGNFYVQQEESAQARDAFGKTLELQPGHIRAKNNLGVLQLRSGNPDIALGLLNEVVQADPEFASAWLNLALAKEDTGAPPAEVLAALETYLRLSGKPDAPSEAWQATLRAKAVAQP